MTNAIDPSAADFGKYRLLRKLAQGGMAEIFLAIQKGIQGFEKVVVVKRVLPDLSASDEFVNMFLDEARIAARLDHTNIVRIYDLGEVNGLYYIAMEYIAGEDLASVLQQCKRKNLRVPIEVAVDAIVGAAEGLAFAHDLEDNEGRPMNLVHRDVSPSNILITYQGVVKVVDFGIARAETNVSKTEGGQVKGKIQYLSPEQCRGIRVDRRSDIFALGITLYELLTNQRLFQRENPLASIHAILGDPLQPPSSVRPEIPPELDAIVMKALERQVEDRYASANELAAALSVFLIRRDYVRGGTKFVEFLTELFGEERKRTKLRVAQGLKLEELTRSPGHSGSFPAVTNPRPGSQSGKLASGQFTPVRSDAKGQLPELTPGGSRVRKPPTNPSSPHLPAVATPSPAAAEEVQIPLVEAEVVPSGLGRGTKLAAVLGAALVVVLVGVGLALRSAPQPSAPVKVEPPPPIAQPAPPQPAPAPPANPPPEPGLEVGGLRFTGVPAGARVTVDGNVVGNPAAESFFAAGKRQVVVEAKGFLPFETTVELTKGKVAVVEATLKPRPVEARGTIEISCQPWCQITLDGRDTGKTSPARLSVSPGSHTLLLSNGPAGLAKKLTVSVSENQVVKKTVKLDD